MAHSYIKYNGDGETVGPYVLPFPYISTTHIEVTVDGIEVTFSWLTSSTIQLDSAPAAGTVIFIKRKTARDSRLVDYTGGSVLSEEDLDTDSKQAFYLVQEAYDWITLNADEDGLVFQDRDVMLNALTGYLDTSHLTEQLHQNLNYMVEKFFTLDAILDPSAGTDAVLEHGIVESPLSAINYAGIDVVADSAQIVQNVAAISTNASGVSYNAAEISLLADEYMVRLDANGYVAGFGLYNGGVGQSEFIVNADKFAMVNGSGTGKKYPFVVTSDVVYIDGDLLVTGSVDTDHLAADAITTAKIAADAVTATEINVSTLSAVAADVGVVTAGVLKSDNWSSTAGTWLDLDDGGLWIRSGNGIFIEQGGDITLEGKYGDPGKIIFEQNGSVVCELDPSVTDYMSIKAGSSDDQLDIIDWGYANLGTSYRINLETWDNANYSTQIYMEAIDVLNTAYIKFAVEDNGTTGVIHMDSGVLFPYTHKGMDLGTASKAWDYIYHDHITNVADFYWMDEREENGKIIPLDDIATIKAIKPSKEIDPNTGLRLINDSTIPVWLAHKQPRDGELRDEKTGDRIQTWKKGDVAVNPEGKPYLEIKTMISLLMGAVRQLDDKIEDIKEKSNGNNRNPRG